MPADGYVDRTVRNIQSTGKSKSSSIAIAKAKGLVKQKGAHLAMGPKAKKYPKGKKSMHNLGSSKRSRKGYSKSKMAKSYPKSMANSYPMSMGMDDSMGSSHSSGYSSKRSRKDY